MFWRLSPRLWRFDMSKRVLYPKSFKETTFACFSQIPRHPGHRQQTHTMRIMLRSHTNQIHITRFRRLRMGVRRYLGMHPLWQRGMVSTPDTPKPVAMKS